MFCWRQVALQPIVRSRSSSNIRVKIHLLFFTDICRKQDKSREPSSSSWVLTSLTGLTASSAHILIVVFAEQQNSYIWNGVVRTDFTLGEHAVQTGTLWRYRPSVNHQHSRGSVAPSLQFYLSGSDCAVLWFSLCGSISLVLTVQFCGSVCEVLWFCLCGSAVLSV